MTSVINLTELTIQGSYLLFIELTLNQLMWKIWCFPNNASRWQIGFNSTFKGL